MESNSIEALNIIFFGTQPTFTQVPPSFFYSITQTFFPNEAALSAEAIPPLPAPITMKSKNFLDVITLKF